MKPLRTLLVLSTLAFSTHAFAHSDHAPPMQVAKCKAECTKDEVLDGAKKFLPELVGNAKLEASWKDAVASIPEQKKTGDVSEWLVTFKNDKATDKAKQTIYMFITTNGALAGVNFTGK